tara:strand:- start:1025 stop:1744 length:720 start_codon:yes stop_codon:yes gene_type:complete
MLIQNNPNYKFKFVVNTSYENIVNPKWENTNYYVQNIDKSKLEYNIKTAYNNDDVEIIYSNLNVKEVDNFYIRTFFRIKNTLNNFNWNEHNYDKVIYIRPDVIFNKKIILDDYDGFNIICGNIWRECNFHYRDWDLCWIGDKKPFEMWCFLHLYQLKLDGFDNETIFNDEVINYSRFNAEKINFYNNFKDYHDFINKTVNLITDDETILHTHYILYFMINHNITVTTHDDNETFVEIIR